MHPEDHDEARHRQVHRTTTREVRNQSLNFKTLEQGKGLDREQPMSQESDVIENQEIWQETLILGGQRKTKNSLNAAIARFLPLVTSPYHVYVGGM